MRESKVWGLPVAVFMPLLVALLVAAAFRQMQPAAAPAAGAGMSDMLELAAPSNPEPDRDEAQNKDAAPSNEISDFPQLD